MNFLKQKEITGHAAAVYCCVAAGNYIYSGSADKFVGRWLIDQGVQDKFAIQFEQSIYALELLSDNVLAVGLADGGLHFFDVDHKKELKYFTQHTSGIFAIRYNATKKQLYVGDAEGNLSIWDDQFNLLIYLPLDCGKIRSIDIDKEGNHFALAGQDENIRVFEVEHFNEIATIPAHKNGVTSVLFSPHNGDEIISGGKDALLHRWNWRTGELLQEVVAHYYSIYAIKAVNDGEKLITASRDKTLKVWQTDNLQFLQKLDLKEGGHRHSVNDLSKLDEHTIVSCSDDKRLIVWESLD